MTTFFIGKFLDTSLNVFEGQIFEKVLCSLGVPFRK